ncbi:MAG: hypothetical protein CSA62_09480 [Planctomycetota bacterium]|nr:MAG: hypothetical protein CSA62_09480 [Planctomycetota bacterium]
MEQGSRNLCRATAAWMSAVSFSLIYLVSLFVGASWQSATIRGLGFAFAVWFLGRILLRPLVDTVIDVLTETERKRREAQE